MHWERDQFNDDTVVACRIYVSTAVGANSACKTLLYILRILTNTNYTILYFSVEQTLAYARNNETRRAECMYRRFALGLSYDTGTLRVLVVYYYYYYFLYLYIYN